MDTDRLFTGQRLDDTGLYYYNARYYDAQIGKFVSPDTAAPDLTNPQSLNKYSYCFNNPLKYNDPSGHWPKWSTVLKVAAIVAVAVVVIAAVVIALPVALTAISTAAAVVGTSSIAAVSTTALAVSAGTATAAAAIAPAAAIVAALPVLGTAATTVASVGLASAGIGSMPLTPKTPPNTLYHYTSADAAIINSEGIAARSGYNYTTNLGNLSPQAAQTALNLGTNRPLPTNVYGIDVYKALESGATLSGPSWVMGPNGLPTGAWEWTFDGRIPPWALK